ncbi:MAG: hypothetical protein EA397_00445 [Deltaproteobacteria bacterium]|nr:MAG: hypothetical protein EA397_00445 [Deltaproteobacteria bacterium]
MLLLSLLLWAHLAVADPDGTPAKGDSADARWAEALRAEREGQLSALAQACEALIDAAPSHRRASSCAKHLAALDRRRDGAGGLERAQILEDSRRMPIKRAKPRVLDLWEAADTPQVVRAEAGIWLASRALDTRDAREEALTYTTPLFEQLPLDLPLDDRILALHRTALVAAGRTKEADGLRPPSPFGPPSTTRADRLQIALRRERWAVACGGIAGIGALLLLPGVAGWRRAPRPTLLGLLPIGIAFTGGYLVAEGWEHGAGEALIGLGVGVAALHLLTLGLGKLLVRTRHARWLRPVVAVVSGLTTAALAYLALWWVDALDWIGL